MNALKREEGLTPQELEHLMNSYHHNDTSIPPEVASVLSKYENEGRLAPLIEGTTVVKDIRKVIEEFDVNKDGQLSQEEIAVLVKNYEQHQPGTEVLRRWDTNNDGKLDEEEIRVLLQDVKTTDTALRYTGYSFALRTLIRDGLRYAAYTSDVGESFRPLVARRLVQLTYGISWGYVLGDVVWEGYKASYQRHEPRDEVIHTVVHRTIFQSIASMILPAFLIHSQVKLWQKLLGFLPNLSKQTRKWVPTGAGLALIPFLPFLIDSPVESSIDWVDHKLEPLWKKTKSDKE
eukprot:TRINITY_DN6246_c0_g1_i8.p1 TRINITY_DN6246_c0_g1~~TRINITY_DN6246_c0_g1_i8.p1  ORF type:complete len:329 (-),score=67.85 TRINITY_DN6246_c0_g1_i8:64-933(-)